MPSRPAAYSGDTFIGSGATGSTGGYGQVTTGEQSGTQGYKPFGALGTGTATDLSVSLTTTPTKRIMIVTVYPEINVDNTLKTQTLTVGAYPLQTKYDFTTPTVPDEPPVLPKTGAN